MTKTIKSKRIKKKEDELIEKSTCKESLQVVKNTEDLASAKEGKKDDSPKNLRNILQAVNAVMLVRGDDIFEEILPVLKVDKFIPLYELFLSSACSRNHCSKKELDGLFCLLVHIECNSLKLRDQVTKQTVTLKDQKLFSQLSWCDNFQRLQASETAFNLCLVELNDVLYLF